MRSARTRSLAHTASSANHVAAERVDRRRFLEYAAGTAAMVGLASSGLVQNSVAMGKATHRAASTDSRLPDGTEYVSWEQPLNFSKTYYVDNNSARADDNGPGTLESPFRTINKAAQVLQPGERVVIASGVYRECVRPLRGGTGATRMISYEAAPGAKVFIKGSEVLKEGWQEKAVSIFRRMPNAQAAAAPEVTTWEHELTEAMFPDAYNPFALPSAPADRAWLDTTTVDMGPYFRRRGLVFVDGKPLEPVEQLRELASAQLPGPPPPDKPLPLTGLPPRKRGGPIMQEIGGAPDGRFWVDNSGQAIQVRLPAGTPAEHTIEITTREQAFAPLQKGLAYIRVKGITFQHAGNGYPVPQHWLVSTAGGNHWIIEGNTIEWAGGVGLDIGAPHWSAERVQNAGDSQIVRGNTIRYMGVEGLGGMATDNTLVEDNLIEWVGWEDAERGWESAGAKFHFARNLL
ncbi:MAG TPA: right-handed parallel beta-helix repeat-containing protein, partial [Bryobacteraceae bacterium]|nr:right-handed parallel beta-helix repeat-containing protein [Bryobacteraceae bacterium]